jgi:hypothetical protein
MSQNVDNVIVTVNKAEVYAKVDRGTELRRLIEIYTKELDEIKAYLRDVANTDVFPITNTGTVEIRSPESMNCIQVCPQKSTPVVIVGKDLADLKTQLLGTQFNLMFREVIELQPVSSFEKAFNSAAKDVQNIVRRFVSWRPNVSQVRFPK